MVDINWLQTQEGQKAYQTWIRKLANRAEDRTDIPILVDTNGEIQVWVTINKKYLSKEQFEKLADKSDGEITTKLEFKTKDIIIRELTSIAKSRDALADNENERDIEDWKERVWALIRYGIVSEDALKYCVEEDEDED